MGAYRGELERSQDISDEFQGPRSLKDSVELLISSLKRGSSVSSATTYACQIAYELNDSQVQKINSFANGPNGEKHGHQLLNALRIREVLAMEKNHANVASEAQFLKIMTSDGTLPLGFALPTSNQTLNGFEEVYHKFTLYAQCKKEWTSFVRDFLLANFISRLTNDDVKIRSGIAQGYCTKTSNELHFVVEEYHERI